VMVAFVAFLRAMVDPRTSPAHVEDGAVPQPVARTVASAQVSYQSSNFSTNRSEQRSSIGR